MLKKTKDDGAGPSHMRANLRDHPRHLYQYPRGGEQMSSRFGQRLAVTLCLVMALCLSTVAGVRPAFATHSLMKTPASQNAPQNPGNLTITGQWKYYDRDDSLVPAKNFLVGLYTASVEVVWVVIAVLRF